MRTRITTISIPCLLVLFTSLPASVAGQYGEPETISTFSIVGFDPENGDMGVAVQSKYFAVGSVVPWGRPGVGVMATQAAANNGYGPKALWLMAERGLTPEETAERLLAEDIFPRKEGRQFAIVDTEGNVAVHTGPEASNWAGHRTGPYYAASGNLLAGPEVVEAMGDAFEETEGELAERLMRALEAGQVEGGDRRGMQSAAIMVIRKDGGRGLDNDYYIRLQVDDALDPIAELRRLLNLQFSMTILSSARNLIQEGRIEEGAEQINRVLELSPQWPDGHLAHGFLLYIQDQRMEALRAMETARDLPGRYYGFEDLFNNQSGWTSAHERVLQDAEFIERLFPDGRGSGGGM